MAVADFDGDGDLDLAVNNLGSSFAIYRNESAAGRVAIRLKGLSPNTQAIGAEVALLGGAVPRQHQEVVSGGRYMSGSDPELVFATGFVKRGMTLEITWRSGRRLIVPEIEANRIYEIEEDGTSPVFPRNGPAKPVPWFSDVSAKLGHAAHEQSFDDFARQPSLPRKLSQLGPPTGWLDIDGDGWADLVVGAAKGDRLAIFRNDQHGGFEPLTNAPFDTVVDRDMVSLSEFPGPIPKSSLLVAVSNYEDGQTNGPGLLRATSQSTHWEQLLPPHQSSFGPIAVAQLQAAQPLAVFVGGRVVPGRYPEPASSQLYWAHGNELALDSVNSRALEKVGLVAGSVWTDLDGDGVPELVLACEWGPIRVFRWESDRLTEITHALGLDVWTGWWSGIAAGDFDGDGRMDLVVANWGLNSPYQASLEHPSRLYFGEFSDRGGVDVVETEFDNWRGQYEVRRLRRAIVQAIPDITERFSSHRAFGEASIEKILGPYWDRAHQVEARTLASMVFLNRGDHFDPVDLPAEAQWSAAMTPVVADFDGDGCEDIFLSQNFTPNQPEVPRLDAGRGLMVRGDGVGHFSTVDGAQSGVEVYGDQRGAAACDYDADGRVDLVVTQNGAETRLFHNETAKPGLRVHLQGTPGNPHGIGASIRLKWAGKWGPSREIHAGSGMGSQDSVIQVLGFSLPPEAIQVHWPGGKTTESKLDGFQEVIIQYP